MFTLNSAFANALANSALGSSGAGTYTVPDGDSSTYWFLVVPVADAQPTTFTKGGFTFPCSVVASGINVTNPEGLAVSCNFIRSDGPVVIGGSVVAS